MSFATATPPCPKCKGPTWDERKSQYWEAGNPKNKPIYRCRDKNCNAGIWEEKGDKAVALAQAAVASPPPTYGSVLRGASSPAANLPTNLEARYDEIVRNRLISVSKMANDADGLPQAARELAGTATMTDIQAMAATIFIQEMKR